MNIFEIERAFLLMGELDPEAAENLYPKFSQEIIFLGFGGRAFKNRASGIRYLLQDLRTEDNAGLTEEVRRLLNTRNLRIVGDDSPEPS